MAVKLKHLKNISSPEVLNTYQLLLDSIFGSNLPEVYDSNKTYIKGDATIIKNENGSYILQIVTQDGGTSGTYKPEHWTSVYFTDLFKEGSALDIDFTKATQISDTRPTHRDNVTWFQPVDIKAGDGSAVDVHGTAKHGIIVFKNEHFAAQADEPTSPEVRLWFDYED